MFILPDDPKSRDAIYASAAAIRRDLILFLTHYGQDIKHDALYVSDARAAFIDDFQFLRFCLPSGNASAETVSVYYCDEEVFSLTADIGKNTVSVGTFLDGPWMDVFSELSQKLLGEKASFV